MKLDKIKIPKEFDRRRKLSEDDKALIHSLYHIDGLSIRSISRMFEKKCCRRTIQFVLFPERLAIVNFSGHWEKYKLDRKGIFERQRKHRQHKREVLQRLGIEYKKL